MVIDVHSGSTVPRRQLGRQLHELRRQARLTVSAAAKAAEFSEAKLYRIEGGDTSTRAVDVRVLCEIYGAPADLTEALQALARETKAKGWWHSYGDVINEDFAVYVGLEEAAEQLAWYESTLVPGLLQTADYARSLITADRPTLSPETVERRIQFRVDRQRLLTRQFEPPTLHVVLDESILRRPIGSRETMSGQLRHLLDIGELPNVGIRVMPFSSGTHPGVLTGPFVVLRFPVNGDGRVAEPPTVYVDGYVGTLYLDRPEEIERYDTAWSTMWPGALNEKQSRDCIQAAAKELS